MVNGYSILLILCDNYKKKSLLLLLYNCINYTLSTEKLFEQLHSKQPYFNDPRLYRVSEGCLKLASALLCSICVKVHLFSWFVVFRSWRWLCRRTRAVFMCTANWNWAFCFAGYSSPKGTMQSTVRNIIYCFAWSDPKNVLFLSL